MQQTESETRDEEGRKSRRQEENSVACVEWGFIFNVDSLVRMYLGIRRPGNARHPGDGSAAKI